MKQHPTHTVHSQKAQDKSRAQSVQRAFRVLRSFNNECPEWGVTELAGKLDLPKTVVFRLLTTMKQDGFIEQNSLNQKYRLGTAIFEIAAAYAKHNDLVRVGGQFIRELVEKTQHTAQLGILDGVEQVPLIVVQSPLILGVNIRPGDRRPAHVTATGKAILSTLTDLEVSNLYANKELKPITRKSITSINALLKDLHEIRRRGYAINSGESTAGIMAVAAPVRDYQGRAIGGVSLGWPQHNVPQNQVPNLIQQVLATANEMSRRLGSSLAL